MKTKKVIRLKDVKIGQTVSLGTSDLLCEEILYTVINFEYQAILLRSIEYNNYIYCNAWEITKIL